MPTPQQRRLLLNSVPPLFLFRQEFNAPSAAPISNPFAGEVGAATTVQINSGTWSVIGGYLNIASLPASGLYDQLSIYTAFARQTGRAMLWSVLRSGGLINQTPQGWGVAGPAGGAWNEGSSLGPLILSSSGAQIDSSSSLIAAATLTNGTEYQFAAVLRSTGGFLFIKGGAYTSWTLLWVSVAGSASPMYPQFSPRSQAAVGDKFGYIHVIDLPSPFNTDYGIAFVNDTSCADGTQYAPGTADGHFDLHITTPATITASTWLYFRWDDAGQNGWRIGIDSTDLNKIKLQSVTGGTPTDRIVGGAASGSTAYVLRARPAGNAHELYTRTGAAIFARVGTGHSNALYAAQTGMKLALGAGYTASRVAQYPWQSSLYNVLEVA